MVSGSVGRRAGPSFVPSCGQSRMHLRRRARSTTIDAVLALLAPSIGLLTFPHHFGRPQNPLHLFLGRFVPRYDWKSLRTDCMGNPYGPADSVRAELLAELAADFLIFAIAMFGVCALVTALTSVRVARARPPPRLALWTLVAAVLSVLAWAEFWCSGLEERATGSSTSAASARSAAITSAETRLAVDAALSGGAGA